MASRRQPFEPVDPFKVDCAFCGAIAGTQCINEVTGKPLWRFVAHSGRLSDAAKVQEVSD